MAMLNRYSICNQTIIAFMCVCLCASRCLADEHVCPDYFEMKQTLNEGVEMLKSLPSIDALPEAFYQMHRPAALRDTLSYSDAKELVDKLSIQSDPDFASAFLASERVVQFKHFDLCLLTWNKMYEYCVRQYGKEDRRTVVCMLYQARLHVLVGGVELRSDSKDALFSSGFLNFKDVAEHSHGPQYYNDDHRNLDSHWQTAKDFYLHCLNAYKTNPPDADILQSIRMQLACLYEWSGEYDESFKILLDAFKAKPENYFARFRMPNASLSSAREKSSIETTKKKTDDKTQTTLLILFPIYYGEPDYQKPLDALVDYAIAHKDWPKAAMVSDEILKVQGSSSRAAAREQLGKFFRAYRDNQRYADVWSLADRLVADNDFATLSDSMSILIACASPQEKSKLMDILAKSPATVRDARAFENKGWLDEAESCFVALNEKYPDSNHYEFELAEFYQRRKRWNDAASIYDDLVKSIRQRCNYDADSVKVCHSLLMGVSRSLTTASEATQAFARVKRNLESALGLCNRRIQSVECLKIAEELYTTGSGLERKGDQKTAKKMYASSLEIKDKNLPAFDMSKVPVLVDLARIDADEGNPAAAQLKFERAVSICEKAPKGAFESVQYALEAYGDFLSKTNQQKRSDEIYSWARSLNSEGKTKVAK